MSSSDFNSPKWIEVLADKAHDAHEPIDEALWNRVSAQLPRNRRIGPWLSAAAAAAILAIILVRLAPSTPIPGEETRSTVSMTSTVHAPGEQPTALVERSGRACSRHAEAMSGSKGRDEDFNQTAIALVGHLPQAATNGVDEDTTTNDSLCAGPKETDRNVTAANEPSVATTPPSHSHHPIEMHSPRKNNAQSNTLTLALYGSGDLLAQNKNQTVDVQRPMLMAMGHGRFVEARTITRRNYKHRIPINVGIMANKSLPCNLVAGIGVNYARYSSDVSIDLEHFDQTVQFVGIPVALQWHFWRHGNWSAYIGGEAMAERCIDVDTKLDDIEVPGRIQWSVHGMAGMQYNITDHVGLFVEPKVSHFITEFPITTVRNEHPVNFNLKVGAHVNF